MRGRRGFLLAALFLLVAVTPAAAQIESPKPLDLPEFEAEPGDPTTLQLEGPEPLELRDFEPAPQEPGALLPPIPLPEVPDVDGLAGGLEVFVRAVVVTGNTVFSDDELAPLLEPYRARVVSYADLEALRDSLTLAYIERGYVTSGALIPDQDLQDGTVELQIVEGVLADIEVESDGRLREGYVSSRLQRSAGGVVNVFQIEEQLQLLQDDSRIEKVEAQLLPGERRGESRLVVTVSERPWYHLGAEFNNQHSPAIGSIGGTFDAALTNVTGWGDSLGAIYSHTEGLDDIQGRYVLPLNRFDTTFELWYRETWSDVVEHPFDDLDIKSGTRSYSLTLRQPLIRSLRGGLSVFATAEQRRSKSELLGSAFSFTEGPEDGESKFSLLRFGADADWRGRNQVFAMRSTLTWGLDALDATNRGGDTPDAIFLAWLGQVQGARRFDFLDSQLIGRFDVQLASSPMLGLEQFSMGGLDSVRGYRENQRVRDEGYTGSLEWRVPVWKRAQGQPWLEAAPFVDIGRSWNRDRVTTGPKSLLGLGIGLRSHITDFVFAEVYYAEEIRHIDSRGDYDIQDTSIYFRLRVDLP